MDHQAALILALALALVTTTACDQTLPPRGQVILVVDTDLPAPTIASHFRVDFYSPDGTWYESRSLAIPDKAAWPLSFGLYSEDDVNDKLVVVRLRVYPDGRERDYLGERYEAPPRSIFVDLAAPQQNAGPAPPPSPRLEHAGAAVDETPATEPEPHVTIDRLVLVRVRPGVVSRAVVTLRGACAGTMARLAIGSYRPLSLDEARTCTDTQDVVGPIAEEPVDSNGDAGGVTSAVGTYGGESPCTRTPADKSYACIPSGAFIFGGPRLANVNVESSSPDRIFRVSSFVMDVNEVSVGQYRAALAQGLPMPKELVPDSFQAQYGAACPYTSQPGSRENAGMSCLFWESARAYCNFRGGELPTEAQWEWAATGGRSFKPRFPWGDDVLGCGDADFGRAYADGFGFGPVDSTCSNGGPFALLLTPKDVSQFGISRMGGGLAEWTLDVARPFSALCWQLASRVDPICEYSDSSATVSSHVMRGGSWRSSNGGLDTLTRFFEYATADDFAGFRCVYSQPPGGWQ